MVMLWKTIARAADSLGFNLIVYTGKTINSNNEYEVKENHIYSIVNTQLLDGVIFASSLPGFINMNEYMEFCATFKDIPGISIGNIVPGMPSMLLDNRGGMTSLMNHLITVHNCRRIAFVKGIEDNLEYQARYEGFKDALAKNSIPLDESLVCSGDFRYQAGRDAVKLLLDDRNVAFDAIIGINDGTAQGAMDELIKRGFRIPDDVAVCGYDNLEDAKYTSPPLTSVNYPIPEIAFRACELILSAINGAELHDKYIFDSDIVVRHSCGCFAITEDIEMNREKHPGEPVEQKEEFFQKKKQLVDAVAGCLGPAGVGKYTGNFNRLSDIIFEQGDERLRKDRF